eukprot:TRINITY_DN27399_c0_g1_i1.p1 TRINITY_DN27399_c0_g1~~TRINITY_DN27399_c0_g1_i1.p1  ORF type:complete len:375 (-),score=33.40 TRINITY_DN27399_c0_g1_i1:4-1128(-)
MRAYGGEAAFSLLLGRLVDITDIVAINGYFHIGHFLHMKCSLPVDMPVTSSASRWSPSTKHEDRGCTQLAVWQADGRGLVLGRNMDGEVDVRRCTVSHLLLQVVTPHGAGRCKYVSVAWPGYVGASSAISEDGMYIMTNAGTAADGAFESASGKHCIVTDAVREFVTTHSSSGGNAMPSTEEGLLAALHAYAGFSGGLRSSGGILLIAPGTVNEGSATLPPALVYEGDHQGGQLRTHLTSVAPGHCGRHSALVATNHNVVRRAWRRDAQIASVSFWSKWRFAAAANAVESVLRQRRGRFGVADAQSVLQIVCCGITEFSLVFEADERTLWLATAGLKPEAWDAPYRHWTPFKLDQLFQPESTSSGSDSAKRCKT